MNWFSGWKIPLTYLSRDKCLHKWSCDNMMDLEVLDFYLEVKRPVKAMSNVSFMTYLTDQRWWSQLNQLNKCALSEINQVTCQTGSMIWGRRGRWTPDNKRSKKVVAFNCPFIHVISQKLLNSMTKWNISRPVTEPIQEGNNFSSTMASTVCRYNKRVKRNNIGKAHSALEPEGQDETSRRDNACIKTGSAPSQNRKMWQRLL